MILEDPEEERECARPSSVRALGSGRNLPPHHSIPGSRLRLTSNPAFSKHFSKPLCITSTGDTSSLTTSSTASRKLTESSEISAPPTPRRPEGSSSEMVLASRAEKRPVTSREHRKPVEGRRTISLCSSPKTAERGKERDGTDQHQLLRRSSSSILPRRQRLRERLPS